MAKEKYYAVKEGRVPGIYRSWTECRAQTNGYPNAVFKSFATMVEAEQFMSDRAWPGPEPGSDDASPSAEDVNARAAEAIASLGEDEAVAFTDGSFDPDTGRSAFGAIIITRGRREDRLYDSFGRDEGPEFMGLRNVAAEIEAVKESVRWAIGAGKRKITVFYDYEGIGRFASGEWVPKNGVTAEFVSFLREARRLVETVFEKVPAHSGVDFNVEADELARSALVSRCRRTYEEGTVYFVGLGPKDWERVAGILSMENEGLGDGTGAVGFTAEETDGRTKAVLCQGRYKATVYCYPNGRSYAQGMQTPLFQRTILTAACLLPTVRNMVETLNCYYASEINVADVEKRFDQLLPHYSDGDETHRVTLALSVYDSMRAGCMPECACMLTPVFRMTGYYLSEMTKKTARPCADGSDKARGSLLDGLRGAYDTVRRVYSVWSAGSAGNGPVCGPDEAEDMIERGLTLADDYYAVFKDR